MWRTMPPLPPSSSRRLTSPRSTPPSRRHAAPSARDAMTAALPLLAAVMAALLALALAAWAVPGRLAASARRDSCAVITLLALAALVTGGGTLRWRCRSAFPASAWCSRWTRSRILPPAGRHRRNRRRVGRRRARPEPTAPMLPVFVVGMILTLLAADALSLMLGFELMSVACWVLVLTHHDEPATAPAAQLFAGMAIFGAACLLVSPRNPGDRTGSAVRGDACRPSRWAAGSGRAGAGAARRRVEGGAGAAASLAAPGAPGRTWPGIGTDVRGDDEGRALRRHRVLFDLCGPATPSWWGAPLLIMGAASAVLGGLRANVLGDLKSVLAASTIEHVGFISIGLGVSLAARGADLAPLASLALGGAMLHVLNHSVFKTLAFLCASAAQHGAGTRSLDRLGGLIHRMPVTTACMLAAGRVPRRPAADVRLRQRMGAVPVGARRAADRRPGLADAGRGRGGPDGAGRRPGCHGRGTADRGGVPRPAPAAPAPPPRRRRRSCCGPR